MKIVLVGERTGNRRWVKYEINQSIKLGKGLFGINISKIKDTDGTTSDLGPNPLPSGYPLYQWINGNGATNMLKWVEDAAKKAGK